MHIDNDNEDKLSMAADQKGVMCRKVTFSDAILTSEVSKNRGMNVGNDKKKFKMLWTKRALSE